MRRTLGLLAVAALLGVSVAVPQVSGASPTKVGIALSGQDDPFSTLVAAGAREAAADFKVKLTEVDQVSPSGTWLDEETVISQVTRGHKDLVIAVGFTYSVAVQAAALAHPETNFALVTGAFETYPSNLAGLAIAANEGSFLVGAAAGLESASGKVGYLGALDGPPLYEYEAGFVAGVTTADADATIVVRYIAEPGDYGGFANPELAYQIALEMYESGVDVIYPPSGASWYGVAAAARDYSEGSGTKVWVIGLDIDMYPIVDDDLKPYVLTSMVTQTDVITYDTIAAQVAGAFTAGTQVWDLASNGMDYARSGDFLSPETIATLEGLRQDIIDGIIIVPTVP